MPLIGFLGQVVLISLSGVVSPGPLTALTMDKGTRSPAAGVLVATGHALVELPLMVALSIGLGQALAIPWVQPAIGLVGGLVLIWMAQGLIRGALRGVGQDAAPAASHDRRSPLVGGMLLTVGNPYVLLWWATVGVALLGRSAALGTAGVVAMGVTHWACDLAWCSALSAGAFHGGRYLGRRFQWIVSLLSGSVLALFGVRFAIEGARALWG